MAAHPLGVIPTLLLAEPSVTALVGANGVYPDPAPEQAEYPFITYYGQLVDPAVNLAGGAASQKLKSWSVTLALLASTYAVAKEIELAVLAALDGTRASTVTVGSTDIDVRSIDLQGSRDVRFTDKEGGDVGVYSTELSLILWARLP